MRVMRPWRSLGMILHAEQRQVPVSQPFQSRVIQIDVSQLNFALRQRIRIHREVMVVSRDLNLAGLQLLHRVVPTMMSKLQLESFPAQRDADELMSQANAKDRHSPHESPNAVHRISTRFGISR